METTTAFEPTSLPPSNETEWEFTDYNQRIFIAFLFIVISIVGLAGNLMVIIAVNLSRKLQTATNVFVLNMSCVDFLNCMFLPFNAVSMLSKNGWPLSPTLCSIAGGTTMICLGATLVNLALIAFNRAYLIKNPRANYRKLYTPKKLTVMVVLAWLYPVVAFALPPAFGVGGLGYSQVYKVCFWSDDHPLVYINDSIVALTFLVTFIVILTCYLTIYIHVKRHNRRLQTVYATSHFSSGEQSLNAVNGSTKIKDKGHNSTLDTRARKSNKREIQITKNLFCVVCAFFVCILPYPLTLMVPVKSVADVYAGVLLMANSCVNPIIYSFKHPHFKTVFGHMLHCEYDEIPEPTTQLRYALQEKYKTTVTTRGSRNETGSTR